MIYDNASSPAYSAWSFVVSKTGISTSLSDINSTISVQPNITPSAPLFLSLFKYF